jgi:hypothetical protein
VSAVLRAFAGSIAPRSFLGKELGNEMREHYGVIEMNYL